LQFQVNQNYPFHDCTPKFTILLVEPFIFL